MPTELVATLQRFCWHPWRRDEEADKYMLVGEGKWQQWLTSSYHVRFRTVKWASSLEATHCLYRVMMSVGLMVLAAGCWGLVGTPPLGTLAHVGAEHEGEG